MQQQFIASTTYFLQEGRQNLAECLRVAFEAARQRNINKIVIFTARGEGVRLAIEEFCSEKKYAGIHLVAVSFPQGKDFTDGKGNHLSAEIAPSDDDLFRSHDVTLIRAHLPFDPIRAPFKERGALGQDLSLVGDALSLFGGSMSLCVQAIAIACDAGAIGIGEHVVALTSDTAILAQATSTRRLLRELVIREILCKPAVLTIGRKEVGERLLGEPVGGHGEDRVRMRPGRKQGRR